MQAIIRQMLLRSRTAWKAMRQTAGIRIRTIHSRSPQILGWTAERGMDSDGRAAGTQRRTVRDGLSDE